MNSDPPSESVDATLSAAEQALIDGSADAPHALLGLHPCGHANRLVVFLPDAVSVQLYPDLALRRYGERGLFFREQVVEAPPYRLLWQDRHGHHRDTCDPYSLPLQLQQRDLTSLTQGCLWNAPDILGAHRHTVAGLPGVLFAVWAPDARRVSVVGDFNGWNGVCHPMYRHAASGVWELFIPGLEPGALYKFEIRPTQGSQLLLKADPWGQGMERPPASASVVPDRRAHEWRDTTWMASRATRDWLHTPLSIYEVHLGSWRRGPDGRLLSYRELAPSLAAYAAAQGFTHIEFLPLMEHPFDGSWGYQITGYFAPTRRYGSADDLRYLVDYCHSQGLGVLLDWVPGHFACDSYALAHFDGTALYEHADPRLGVHPDWGTLVFNLGRPEVRNFLIANALYWLESFHVDGLRVDAVASMLYRDYSRPEGAWLPNAYGGRENLEAVAFLRELNHTVLTRHSDVLMIAEESTAWPAVSRPPDHGGLGFSMKWNMGWMHDVLAYM
ncbi:MAG TPA: 1,4-alpha-glucan branching protein GlgB, partial [Acidiferrobacteraceae bacterium]|nr:1,4-alpha-glucan branching protein GlgB [Acidiferrobacteraceae bacterium]